MIGKLDDYLRFNEAALGLRSSRQAVLASNIANADTPNYKARDIDFAAALKSAVAGSTPPAHQGEYQKNLTLQQSIGVMLYVHDHHAQRHQAYHKGNKLA